MQFIYSIFGYPLGWIMWLCYKILPMYALALVLFTIITRLVLLPFSIKQQKSTVQMKLIQPKITEIQSKYANNREKMQQELEALYARENYNPMSGCMPMLIQFPILFGLIDVIYKPLTHIFDISSSAIESATTIAKNMMGSAFSAANAQVSIINAVKANSGEFAKIFSVEEISAISAFDMTFLGLDLSAIPTLGFNILIIIPILAGLSMVLSTWATSKFSGTAQVTNNSNKIMMYSMSLFTVVFTFSVPAGVGMYWIVSNVFGIAQSWILHKIYSPEKLAKEYEEKFAAIEEAKKKKVKVEVNKGGKKQIVEKTLSEKEVNRLRLAKAREMDAEKYGDESNLPTFEENIVTAQETEDNQAE